MLGLPLMGICKSWAMKLTLPILTALLFSSSVFAQGTTPNTPTTPATPPAAQQPKPVVSPIGWPPKLALGQRWVLTLDLVGQWDIALNARDRDGDTIGSAKATTEKTPDFQVFFYHTAKDDVTNLYLSATNGTGYLCQFSRDSLSSNPNDVTMVGVAYRKDLNKPFAKLESLCLVTWTNSPVSPLSIQPSTPSVAPAPTVPTTPPAPSTTPPAPATPAVPASPTNGTATDVRAPQAALALVWPPKLEVRQTWLARIGNLSFDIALTQIASGVARGSAKRGTVTGEAFMFYNSGENRMTLEMNLGKDQFVCSFDLRGSQQKAYTGAVVYRSGGSVAQTLKESCAVFRLK
jgi:hypothetical protein